MPFSEKCCLQTTKNMVEYAMQQNFAIIKEGRIIFIGSEKVVQNAFNCLRDSFYFTAGTSKAREDAFPYRIEQI